VVQHYQRCQQDQEIRYFRPVQYFQLNLADLEYLQNLACPGCLVNQGFRVYLMVLVSLLIRQHLVIQLDRDFRSDPTGPAALPVHLHLLTLGHLVRH